MTISGARDIVKATPTTLNIVEIYTNKLQVAKRPLELSMGGTVSFMVNSIQSILNTKLVAIKTQVKGIDEDKTKAVGQ